MTISGRIKKKKAITITPERLKSLCEIILKHCERLEFSGETYSKTTITFDNLDELLNYDNFKPRRLIGLEITGYINHSRKISIEIGDLNFSPVTNYGSTIRCSYNFPTTDEETIFKSDMDIWFEKAKSSYWLLGKFSFNGALFLPSITITFIRFCLGLKVDIDTSNVSLLLAVIIVSILTVAIIFLFKYIDAYFLGNLFPAIVFNWGEETNRFEKWQKYRSNIFWGIIMAIIVGLVTTYLYDTLVKM